MRKLILTSIFVILSLVALNSKNMIIDDFSNKNPNWHVVTGKWIFKNGVLKQVSRFHRYCVIMRTDKKFKNIEISVDFKPIKGIIDASGGIIFRAQDFKNYYIVRANSLEDNFNLYIYKNGRRYLLKSVYTKAPELKKFHNIKVIVVDNHIKACLDNKCILEFKDNTFKNSGYVGLWTKADSVTIFDNFKALEK